MLNSRTKLFGSNYLKVTLVTRKQGNVYLYLKEGIL
ncbi:hypothetical protein EV207_11389 [Scopulibacillus darangshiensis]|uniref:Uncharacterized protein n=1 Tax=Scopulibacillus darangshiensis TaxID=442528 RepID=A0A4R2P2U2_9BACL|nr:hypothetical protein EV207_11389 [Scopulibacillus darangshiensis]